MGFLCENSLFASDSQTPPRQKIATESEEFTPGRQVAFLQSQIFIKERFTDVLREFPKELASVNWIQFHTQDEAFDTAARRRDVRSISRVLESKFSCMRSNELFSNLYDDFLKIKTAIDQVHPERLWEWTQTYFGQKFPGCDFERQYKNAGDQLGLIALVTPVGAPAIKYFVKTHSGGVKSGSGSAAAGLVKAQELMAYAVLEALGIGCETHFFGRDARNCYIATKDANSDSLFFIFQKAIGSQSDGIIPDNAYGASLWGGLSELITSNPKTNEEAVVAKAIEAEIQDNPMSANFVRQIARLDLITRMMRLTDLLSNSQNFGFCATDQGQTLKVIDFRIADVVSTQQYTLVDVDFGGFVNGNGFFHYHTAHNTVAYILREREISLRVSIALDIMKNELQCMPEAIEEASKRFFSLPQELLRDDKSDDNPGRFRADLNEYQTALRENYFFMLKKLEDWRPQ